MVFKLVIALAIGISAICVPVKSVAQQGLPSLTVATKPEVFLTLVDPDEKVSVWQDLRFQISLTSGSDPHGIGVKSLSISTPSKMALYSDEGKVKIIPGKFEPLTLKEPGGRYDFEPLEIARKRFWKLDFPFFSVLTYRPRKEIFVATLNYEGLEDRRIGTRSAKIVVDVTAHPLGMYAGAILGSLLAAIFLVLPPIKSTGQNPISQSPPETPLPPRRFHDFLVRFARGSVVTGIAVLILQTTSEFTLPINITVHDFYGGVLLGLFGDKVAAAISKWIWGV